jgi:hypothetical protein
MKNFFHVCSLNFKGAGGIKKSIPTLSLHIDNLNHCNSYNVFSFKELFFLKKQRDSYFFIHSSFQLLHLCLVLFVANRKLFWVPRGSLNSSFLSFKKELYIKLFLKIASLKNLDITMIYLNDNERLQSCLDLRCQIIPNGIEVKKYIIPSLFERYEKKRIVFLSRFDVHQKGLDRIYDLLLNTNLFLDFEIYMYGASDDSELNLVNDMFSEFNNVHCYLSINSDEIKKVMNNATYHILLSRCEGMPMSCLESLSFSVPQLISDETNILSDIIENNCGFDYLNIPYDKLSDIKFSDYEVMCNNSLMLSCKYDWHIIAEKFSKL